MSPVNVEEVARVVLDNRPDAFLELMARELGIPPEHLPRVRGRLEKIHDELKRALVRRLEEVLKDRRLDVVLTHPDADHLMIVEVKQDILKDLLHEGPAPIAPLPLTPELREWALAQDTEEEIVAGLQEARQENGPELIEVVRRLEQEFQDRERARP